MLSAPLALLGFALAVGACNTTTTEFLCGESSDCGIGTCEDSSHCSFIDSECESGYRFGASSGSESGLCVEETDAPDAGSDLQAPIARINDEFSLPCDQTTLQLDASGSEAFGGATVDEYTWSILRGTGPAIVFTEAGDSVITPSPYRTAGTGVAPFLNLRSYAGRKAAQLDLVGSFDVVFFQKDLSLLAGAHTLYLAAASDGDEPIVPINVVLREMTTTLAVMSWTITPESDKFNAYTKDFVIPGGLGASMKLEIRIEGGQSLWIDNIAIVYDPIIADPSVVSENTSFELGREPWDSDWSGIGYDALIPQSLLRPSTTQVELSVKDSQGLSSTPVQISVPVTLCQ